MDLRAIFGAEDAGIQMYFKDGKTKNAVNTLFARIQIRAVRLTVRLKNRRIFNFRSNNTPQR